MSISHTVANALPSTPPKDVPPPTPVNFPRYFADLTAGGAGAASGGPSGPTKKLPLTAILQSIVRPTDIGLEHFQALGVHIKQNAEPTVLIPEYHTLVPDFSTWEDISYDDARELNESTRRPLNNGNRSPGIQTYLDRRRELSIDNNAAYRSVRRMQPLQPGQPAVRLGNAYEFYRHLESFSAYWDDTSMALPPDKNPSKSPSAPSDRADAPDSKTANEQGDESIDADGGDGNESGCDSVSSASSTAVTTDSESKPSSPAKDGVPSVPEFRFYRTNAGSQMPPEYRLHIITAFLKLVAYDFGCNVSAPRVEPRLYLNTGTISLEEAQDNPSDKKGNVEDQKQNQDQPHAVQALRYPKGPSSYFSSGCVFVFRTPSTREAARAGFVDGPLAAVSARHTTTFSSSEEAGSDKDSSIDLARELVAALLTAQHRAREGRAERRIGKGEWWATKPRWGGGSGGPIGREVDSAPNTDEVLDTTAKEEGAGTSANEPGGGSGLDSGAVSSGLPRPGRFSSGRGAGGISGGGGGGRANLMNALESAFSITGMPVRGATKKPRKGLAMYDNYRMVRPPSSSWDKKTRFQAIGRKVDADYDDIFVVSALFHHMSIVRMRVPQRLLQALDGVEAGDDVALDGIWAGLEVVRSPWFDFFKFEDRLKAMRLSWAMMAYLLREQDTDMKMGGDA
ncbi:hypothetical protein SPBR_06785 [Sporothrix brasiliensis 5110]|uniref:Uncharacterized protein n=1 Tax=Sporothrix brasiliensis 5110 TaxID=1398154 RepID=A0A0C2IVE2_9PEZI|nr:uncharacterized protein SPBR_06785 [Sporothrix brasiliensis 5110]KIH88962.1 hypothetical protein SPBR_06785 [Sporothrix brasiliensis 5110]